METAHVFSRSADDTQFFIARNVHFNDTTWKIYKVSQQITQYSGYYVNSESRSVPTHGWQIHKGVAPVPIVTLSQDHKICTISNAGSGEYNGTYKYDGEETGIGSETNYIATSLRYKKV